MTPVQGKFYRNASSASLSAELVVDASGYVSLKPVKATDFSTSVRCQFTELDVSPRLGSTPRYLVFENGDRFETLDNDSIDALLVTYQRNVSYRFIHQLESRLHLVLVAVVLVVVFIWGFVQYGVPVMAKSIAQTLPENSSQYLGQGALDILDKTVFSPSDLPQSRQQNLTALFQSYAKNYPEYSFEFLFRKGGKIGANAMALPDGRIVFTDEMVALAENDNELLAILGHEIGHVVHQHVLRRIIQDSMLTVVVVMITGDISSASSVVVAMPSILLELAFSREFEREADDFAYDFLISNRIETVHFANIMQRLTQAQMPEETAADDMPSEPEDFLPYLSTHPASKNRIQKFQNKMSGWQETTD